MVVVGGRREGGREGGRGHQPVEPPPVSHCQHRTELDTTSLQPSPAHNIITRPGSLQAAGLTKYFLVEVLCSKRKISFH